MKTFLTILVGVVAAIIVIMLLMGKKYHFETSAVINAPGG